MTNFSPYAKPKTIRLKGKALEQLRRDVFTRANGICENCMAWAPWDGDIYTRGHMRHRRSRGAGGSDTLDNVYWWCYTCHFIGEHSPRWSKKCNK